ncbi:NUDIX hydrolase [Demetria terragena]|uniref:NUDIX hydrolase n=1 Tax=Demetria terragena TaxID=63959 RepID=UPI00037D1B9B|nr:NUDIX domain-containing protein [Demetria terragena]
MSTVVVIGRDAEDKDVVREVLAHGADPRIVLGIHGFRASNLLAIERSSAGFDLTFRVHRATVQDGAPRTPRSEVSAAAAATAIQHCRVGAYAVLDSDLGVLLTKLVRSATKPELWLLPGGGVDPGEHPDQAVLREVWEETGQRPVLGKASDVLTDHWIGPAPNGEIEDFQAVRVIYRGHVPDPSVPVVHDVGGTTASAAWIPRTQLGSLNISSWCRALLSENAE